MPGGVGGVRSAMSGPYPDGDPLRIKVTVTVTGIT